VSHRRLLSLQAVKLTGDVFSLSAYFYLLLISVKYCDHRVCLSVCLLAYVKNHTSKLRQIFYTCYCMVAVAMTRSSSDENAECYDT